MKRVIYVLFVLLVFGVTGCVSTYDSGVKKAVAPRPGYGPERPYQRVVVTSNPKPGPRPNVKAPHYGADSPARPVPPAKPVGPVSRPVTGKPGVNQPLNSGVSHPVDTPENKTGRENQSPKVSVIRPSNVTQTVTISRQSGETVIEQGQNHQTEPVSRPGNQSGHSCRTDSDCYGADRCISGHCVRQR